MSRLSQLQDASLRLPQMGVDDHEMLPVGYWQTQRADQEEREEEDMELTRRYARAAIALIPHKQRERLAFCWISAHELCHCAIQCAQEERYDVARRGDGLSTTDALALLRIF